MLKKPAMSAAPAPANPPTAPHASTKTLEGHGPHGPQAVLVHELPVRLWHWVSVAAISVLSITGYLIGHPLPSTPGEASSQFLMGYIRFAHFSAGYVFASAFVGRLYWAFVGNRVASELFTLPVFSAKYWRGLVDMLKWYAFLGPQPEHYEGHNPLARTSMVFGYTFLTLWMTFTGFALYGEGTQAGSWAERWFGWVIAACGQSQDVHTLHHLGMWAMLVFVIAHVYAVVRDDIVGEHSTISSMISGWRASK